MNLDDLLPLRRSQLHAALEAGHPVDLELLRDREFHGISLGLPRLIELLTWKKFKKVFVTQPGGLGGYNEAVVQNGLDAPWIARERRGEPVRYGPFAVVEQNGGALIDYGPPAGRFDPMRWVRDPLVTLVPGTVDLLLGVSLVALGPLSVPTPTYFALLPGPSVG